MVSTSAEFNIDTSLEKLYKGEILPQADLIKLCEKVTEALESNFE